MALPVPDEKVYSIFEKWVCIFDSCERFLDKPTCTTMTCNNAASADWNEMNLCTPHCQVGRKHLLKVWEHVQMFGKHSEQSFLLSTINQHHEAYQPSEAPRGPHAPQ
ncbi:related to cell cycle arrest protein BUB2 [Sporisorium scitamineum]|uniref:Related to cell cycle arrest protein BUB2 n=1 Tax=Sporisorium scitamineum TaxID=49012 RepID=A0A127Z4H0_9BASI|nr:related to cell cycle arrest protein BUB2 [Sporisorium scitamineum]